MLLCHLNNTTNLCGDENKKYYMCKRERDAVLFSRVKSWEIEEMAKVNTEERNKYIANLD